MAMEIERKYLIALPEETVLAEQSTERWEIVQTYLRSAVGVTARVRKLRVGEETRCFHTEKRRISALAAEELEEEISEEEYDVYLLQADPDLRPIQKCRWRIPYMGHVLEVDVYPFWEKTAVLEIELSDESEAAEIPAWICVLKDVTGDARFKNVCLAREVPSEDSL